VLGFGFVSLMVPGAAMHGQVHCGQLVSGLVRAVVAIISAGRVCVACRSSSEERVVIHNV
jgi:hypothetical protein